VLSIPLCDPCLGSKCRIKFTCWDIPAADVLEAAGALMKEDHENAIL
jgi:hypothetical protein